MLFLLIIFIMLIIAVIDVPSMIQHQSWPDLRAYLVLWTVAVALGMLQTAGVNIPNPTGIIVTVMPQIGETVSSFLGLR